MRLNDTGKEEEEGATTGFRSRVVKLPVTFNQNGGGDGSGEKHERGGGSPSPAADDLVGRLRACTDVSEAASGGCGS